MIFNNCQQQNQHNNLKKKQERIQIGNRNLVISKSIGNSKHGKTYYVQDSESKEEFVMKSKYSMTKEEQEFTMKMKERRFKNLVNVIEYYFDGRYHHILMEKCEGDMFNLYVEKKKITDESFRHIALEIARGIKELHDIGLVHRDIKPENIMIFKQVDKLTRHSQDLYKLGDFQLIKDNTVAQTLYQGTPYYLSPEQLGQSNNNYSYPVDIWAFGAVLYELCSQQVLFQGQIQEEIYQKIKNQEIEPFINRLAINQDYKNLILQMLNRDSSKRPTIDQIIKKLEPKLRTFKSSGEITPNRQQANTGFSSDNKTNREVNLGNKEENHQNQIIQQQKNVKMQQYNNNNQQKLDRQHSEPGQINQVNIQQQINQQSKQIKQIEQYQNDSKQQKINIFNQGKQNCQFFQKSKIEWIRVESFNTEKQSIQKKNVNNNQDDQVTIKPKIIKKQNQMQKHSQ